MAITDGLSSVYHEEDNTDSFGGRNLTDSNISYSAGKFGNCAVFNGSSSKQTGTHNLGTGNISFSYYGWVYVTGTQTRGEILSIGNQATLNQGIHFSIRTKASGNDAVYFDYSQSAGNSTTARVNYNAWNFIAIRKNGNTIEIRINNGSFESFTKALLNILTTTMIFGDYGAGLAYLNGKIDEVGLFTTQKTNDEFDSFYNGGNGRAYPYNMDAGLFMFFNS